MADQTQPMIYPGWKTVRKIGEGSFGAVYEIERDLFGKTEKAALKVISIPQNDSDIEDLYNSGYDKNSVTEHFKNSLSDIIREYTMMSEMKGHSNVVNCDDVRYVQHDDGIGWDIFIRMELLKPMMKLPADIMTEARTVRLGRDICRALVLCKSLNIVHRDIKPQNIFVNSRGDFKLGDFGIAKTMEKTTGGTKIGTYSYMAPEVYNNEPYGSASDIYALGLVLYWTLNEKRLPFLCLPPAVPTGNETEQSRARRFAGEKIPAPVHGSEELKRIVLKACEFKAEDRYQTAADMLKDLEALPSEEEPLPEELFADAAGERPEPQQSGDATNAERDATGSGGTSVEEEEETEAWDEAETVGTRFERTERALPREEENTQTPVSGTAEREEASPKKKKRLVLLAIAILVCGAGAFLLPMLFKPSTTLKEEGSVYTESGFFVTSATAVSADRIYLKKGNKEENIVRIISDPESMEGTAQTVDLTYVTPTRCFGENFVVFAFRFTQSEPVHATLSYSLTGDKTDFSSKAKDVDLPQNGTLWIMLDELTDKPLNAGNYTLSLKLNGKTAKELSFTAVEG